MALNPSFFSKKTELDHIEKQFSVIAKMKARKEGKIFE